ncbi:hypothetical protein [Celerinatantimonas sp. MCCC 1A17872]|uniref:hypothetical protein n=1 Tax=Celerinatantimonas sp. MCCC 1A17872 TaxID=3177514 RepID=UPI0038BF0E60
MNDVCFYQAWRACDQQNIDSVMEFVRSSAGILLAAIVSSLAKQAHQQEIAEQVLADSYCLFALNTARFAKLDEKALQTIFFEILARRLSLSQQTLAKHAAASQPGEESDSIILQKMPNPQGIAPSRVSALSLLEGVRGADKIEYSKTWMSQLELRLRYYLDLAPNGYAGSGEAIYPGTFDSRYKWQVRLNRVKMKIILALRQSLVSPLVSGWLKLVSLTKIGRRWLIGKGLPRLWATQNFAEDLTLSIDPLKITKMAALKRPVRKQLKQRFLWDGDWDEQVEPFVENDRYVFISDIWQHRDCPQASEFYTQYMAKVASNKAFVDHFAGIALTSSERIFAYIQHYLFYMYNMACFGFEGEYGKDSVWVALDRNSSLVKVKHGLHRTAMAQVLGLKRMTVKVRGVHHLHWQNVTLEGLDDLEAFERFMYQLKCLD